MCLLMCLSGGALPEVLCCCTSVGIKPGCADAQDAQSVFEGLHHASRRDARSVIVVVNC